MNLQQRNPAESGRHASATISFFFRFERDKKEETINLQPCLLVDRENFRPFFETENIPNAIFGRDLYEQKTILGGGGRNLVSKCVNQLFRRAFEE